MIEEWKDIKGYEGIYQISNMGNLKNREGKLLKFSYAVHGYAHKPLYKDDKSKTFYIHRLVAEHFIENPMGYAEVNHINEDKSDNRATNLEWVSREYNTNYGNRPRNVGMYAKRNGGNTVYQYNRDNTLVREYRSLREAEKMTGFCRLLISKYLDTGIAYRGFLWKR